MMKKQGLIFIISGPSGSGKTTLLKHLLQDKELKSRLTKSISFTTRPRRSREDNRKEYFFITDAQFRQARKQEKILEWTKYLGYYYATPKDFVEKQLNKGKHIVLCLDLKGALKIKRLYADKAVTIFILPPSLEALRHRIGSRCNRTKKEEIANRLKLAQIELRACCKYDYCLVNKHLVEAVKELKGIVVKLLGLKSEASSLSRKNNMVFI